MKNKDFTYIVWQEDKHFVAQCLDVDVSSFGDTHTEAMANLKEAIELYFEDVPHTLSFPLIQQPTIHIERLQYA